MSTSVAPFDPTAGAKGIGRAVLGWEMAHGLGWDLSTRQAGYGPLVMRLHAPSEQVDVRDLAERHGLAIERYFFEMSRRLEDTPSVPELHGVRIVDWCSERSREVHGMVDRAFRDHWGHTDRTDAMWDEVVGSRAFRPDWSVLALDEATATVVGVAVNCAYEQDWQAQSKREGYTDQLAVAHTHRGRGVAKALLKESMGRFTAAGMDAAALGVDSANTSGALRLYQGLGYRQTASTCVHQFMRAGNEAP